MTAPAGTPEVRYPATEAGVEAALAALGFDADKVAEVLEAGGHRGRLKEARCCPVAAYLLAVVDGAEVVEVDKFDVALWGEGTSGVHVDPPAPVAEFVPAFDNGGYPQLVRADEDGD